MTDRDGFDTPDNEAGDDAFQATEQPTGCQSGPPGPYGGLVMFPRPASRPADRGPGGLSDLERRGGARGQIIDLRRYRLARVIRNAGRQQGELARLMRESAAERQQLADALQATQGHLVRISNGYKRLLKRLQREKMFRTACQEAAELEDLDEMVRRRDALVRELEDIRSSQN